MIFWFWGKPIDIDKSYFSLFALHSVIFFYCCICLDPPRTSWTLKITICVCTYLQILIDFKHNDVSCHQLLLMKEKSTQVGNVIWLSMQNLHSKEPKNFSCCYRKSRCDLNDKNSFKYKQPDVWIRKCKKLNTPVAGDSPAKMLLYVPT